MPLILVIATVTAINTGYFLVLSSALILCYFTFFETMNESCLDEFIKNSLFLITILTYFLSLERFVFHEVNMGEEVFYAYAFFLVAFVLKNILYGLRKKKSTSFFKNINKLPIFCIYFLSFAFSSYCYFFGQDVADLLFCLLMASYSLWRLIGNVFAMVENDAKLSYMKGNLEYVSILKSVISETTGVSERFDIKYWYENDFDFVVHVQVECCSFYCCEELSSKIDNITKNELTGKIKLHVFLYPHVSTDLTGIH